MAGFTPGVTAHAAYDPSGILINGEAPRRLEKVTLLSGVTGVAGHLLGKITASGKYKVSTTGAADGSELPSNLAVLVEDCDASGGDKTCLALITGDVDFAKLTVGASWTYDLLKDVAPKYGLHVHNSYAITE